MLAKLGVIASVVAYVSALTLRVPSTVTAGSVVSIDVDISSGDPTEVGLVLQGPSVNDVLDPDAQVAPTIDVDIPSDVSGSRFRIAATEVDNPDNGVAINVPNKYAHDVSGNKRSVVQRLAQPLSKDAKWQMR